MTTKRAFFEDTTTPAKARGYLGMMGVAYGATFASAVTGQIPAIWACLIATGIVELGLYLTGHVRTKMPLSVPLGMVAMAGLALRLWFSS